MGEENKVGVTFVRKGDHVEMRVKHPNLEMDSRRVLEEINALKQNIKKMKDDVKSWEMQIAQVNAVIPQNEERLKDLSKFEEDMKAIQVSKAKAIAQEVRATCIEAVEKAFKPDPSLPESTNLLTKYQKLQFAIATSPPAKEQLAPEIIRQCYFIEPVIENPWPVPKKE